MSPRARLVLWAPVALLLAFQFWLSSRTALPKLPFDIPHLDKLEHAGYFLLMGLLALRAGRFGERWSRGKTTVFLILFAVLWGCLDEIHQSFVPMRSVELGDVLADTTGVALAVIFGEPLLRKLRLDQTIR
jgi:VanZ family protein